MFINRLKKLTIKISNGKMAIIEKLKNHPIKVKNLTKADVSFLAYLNISNIVNMKMIMKPIKAV
jgi:hypothetical protein